MMLQSCIVVFPLLSLLLVFVFVIVCSTATIINNGNQNENKNEKQQTIKRSLVGISNTITTTTTKKTNPFITAGLGTTTSITTTIKTKSSPISTVTVPKSTTVYKGFPPPPSQPKPTIFTAPLRPKSPTIFTAPRPTPPTILAAPRPKPPTTLTGFLPKQPPVIIKQEEIVQPDDLPIRINCGYERNDDWIDPKTKYRWKNDYGYSTTTGSLGILEKTYCGKGLGANDAISCSYRHGYIINYTIPVLQSRERYKVTFLVDEPMFTSINARLFDIYVEGVLMRSNVDIIAITTSSARNGFNRNGLGNISVASNERVKDGTLNKVLKSVQTPKNRIQKALINGMIIEISPYRQFIDFPLRINCGSSVSWINPINKMEWLPDTDYDKPTLAVNDCLDKPNPFSPNDLTTI
jgi:Malectin domain